MTPTPGTPKVQATRSTTASKISGLGAPRATSTPTCCDAASSAVGAPARSSECRSRIDQPPGLGPLIDFEGNLNPSLAAEWCTPLRVESTPLAVSSKYGQQAYRP